MKTNAVIIATVFGTFSWEAPREPQISWRSLQASDKVRPWARQLHDDLQTLAPLLETIENEEISLQDFLHQKANSRLHSRSLILASFAVNH